MKKTQHASNIKWPPPFNLSLSLSYSFSSLSRSHLREWELAVSIVAAAYLLLCFCSNGKKFRKKFFFSLPFVFKCTVEKKDIARGKNKKNGKQQLSNFPPTGPRARHPPTSFAPSLVTQNFVTFSCLLFSPFKLSLSLSLSFYYTPHPSSTLRHIYTLFLSLFLSYNHTHSFSGRSRGNRYELATVADSLDRRRTYCTLFTQSSCAGFAPGPAGYIFHKILLRERKREREREESSEKIWEG